MAGRGDAKYTNRMAQLTRQDIAEVVEEVLDRKLDEKLDQKLDEKLDEKLGLQPGQTLDDKLGLQFGETLDQKLDRKFGAYIEHVDDKFDSLAEVISLMNTTMGSLARQSDLSEVKEDVKTIKLAVADTNKDLHHLEDRFDRFERAFI